MNQAAAKTASCRFYGDNGPCNGRVDKSSSYFCSAHKGSFASLTNRDLLEKAAHNLRATFYITDQKKVHQTTDPRLLGPIDTLFCELQARGYRPGEMIGAITEVQDNLGLNDDLDRAVGRDPKWRIFERVIAGIQKLTDLGATVIHNDRIRGTTTGRMRQIDVSVRFNQGQSQYLVIVECKRSKRKISVDKVEALITKMRDVGGDRALMVTNTGYQAGAVAAARANNIDLRTLEEQVQDWTTIVKNDVTRFPFFAGADFDHDPVDARIEEQWSPVSYDDIMFLRTAENKPSVSFSDLIKNIATQLYKKGEPLPAEVTVPFQPTWHMQLTGRNRLIEIRSVKLMFEPYLMKTERRLDVPPRISHYSYASVITSDRQDIPLRTVPLGLQTVIEARRYYEIKRGGFYKCLTIEGNDVLWLEMLPRRDEVGNSYHREFVQEISCACYYSLVTNEVDLVHLEAIYSRLLEYQQRFGT